MLTADSVRTVITALTGSSAEIAILAFLKASPLLLAKPWRRWRFISTLSDAFQREYLSSVKFSHDIYYDELEKLRIKHGYTKESNA